MNSAELNRSITFPQYRATLHQCPMISPDYHLMFEWPLVIGGYYCQHETFLETVFLFLETNQSMKVENESVQDNGFQIRN